MTQLLIRLFVKNYQQADDPAVRTNYGKLAGSVGIFCNLLLALGYKGLGKEAESQVALQAPKDIDPWNLKLCFLEKLGVL